MPAEADLTAYRELRRRQDARATFRDLSQQRARRQTAGRGGLGITLDIPGGSNSAFTTIFGKNEVDLRVNGNANVDLGFSYQKNEQQEAITGQSGRLDPDFGQELGLSVRGTIGDKLRIDVNYDTQNTFEFENQVKLLYTGYDDEIIQRVEAGNVFLQTPSDLIQGGQRLFGIRTDLQLGGLQVTAVASQQDAESDELELSGGAQTTEFSLDPTDYENNAHFFLGYYFRNHWDYAHSRPPAVLPDDQFSGIDELVVWISDQSVVSANPTEGDEFSCAVALVDLAEPAAVRQGGSAYLDAFGRDAPLPRPDVPGEAYDDAFLALVADGNTGDTQALLEGAGLRDDDYAARRFRRLEPGLDYSYSPVLGTLSLERRLTESEVLAVQYTYRDPSDPSGVTVTVGSDIGEASQGSNCNVADDRLILKLLRGDSPTPQAAFWDLTMRNIYQLGGRSINSEDFQLTVTYEAGSNPQRTFPNVTVGQQQTIDQVLGLDRVDSDSNPTPDDRFDFIPLTFDSGSGRLYFPYLEPFGGRVRQVLSQQQADGASGIPSVSFQAGDLQSALGAFAFDTLYALKPERVQQVVPNVRRYAISGSYRSAVQSSYNLGFAVVEGSVEVRAGSQRLTEGVDYQVDYILGEVNITNQSYLSAGRDISISFERNQFAAIGKKTLLGVRAGYQISEDAELGATWMRLSERPLADKYRVGEEPISNQIYGFDARYAAEPRWMTRFTDALPFVQTRAASFFEFKGEYARLLPGHPETRAFEQTRQEIQGLGGGRDFAPDERRGLSFVDDFEGTENSFSLGTAGIWRLAAPPTGAGPDDAVIEPPDDDISSPLVRANWRGLFTWYNLSRALYQRFDALSPERRTDATRFVRLTELFPSRRGEIEEAQDVVTPLDLYFDPARRGPYNFNETIGRDQPGGFGSQDPEALKDAWGGMVQRLPDGYRDFDGRNNVEFVEMIVAVYGGRNGNERVSGDGRLYIDLGRVSEDVLPNGQTNREDGLRNRDEGAGEFGPYGRFPTGQQNAVVDYDDATGVTEDLGLDGLRSAPGDGEYARTERDYFSDFLSRIGSNGPDAFAAREDAAPDPSADDYYHYEDAYFDDPNRYPGPNRATAQERFSRFFPATELNSFESQNQIVNSGHPGNSREPDTESLSLATQVETQEQFYRFSIPLDSALFSNEATNPFFVDRLVSELNDGTRIPSDWALIRIPVRERSTRQEFGNIADFSLIESIRVWTDGHERPVTIRMAEIQLVGSQWIKSDQIGGIARPGPRPVGARPARRSSSWRR